MVSGPSLRLCSWFSSSALSDRTDVKYCTHIALVTAKDGDSPEHHAGSLPLAGSEELSLFYRTKAKNEMLG